LILSGHVASPSAALAALRWAWLKRELTSQFWRATRKRTKVAVHHTERGGHPASYHESLAAPPAHLRVAIPVGRRCCRGSYKIVVQPVADRHLASGLAAEARLGEEEFPPTGHCALFGDLRAGSSCGFPSRYTAAAYALNAVALVIERRNPEYAPATGSDKRSCRQNK
jgi:hypothetical protein